MSRDFSDLAFRFLFSLIFIGLGAEHAFSDELIQRLMPDWIPYQRGVSALCGLLLVCGGLMIALGYRLRMAATALGIFLVVVTAAVHAPALAQGAAAPIASEADRWLWDTLQRSNFVKNLCLLGVCIMLQHYRPGKWSLQRLLGRESTRSDRS